jgi:hypothetical protein
LSERAGAYPTLAAASRLQIQIVRPTGFEKTCPVDTLPGGAFLSARSLRQIGTSIGLRPGDWLAYEAEASKEPGHRHLTPRFGGKRRLAISTRKESRRALAAQRPYKVYAVVVVTSQIIQRESL